MAATKAFCSTVNLCPFCKTSNCVDRFDLICWATRHSLRRIYAHLQLPVCITGTNKDTFLVSWIRFRYQTCLGYLTPFWRKNVAISFFLKLQHDTQQTKKFWLCCAKIFLFFYTTSLFAFLEKTLFCHTFAASYMVSLPFTVFSFPSYLYSISLQG